MKKIFSFFLFAIFIVVSVMGQKQDEEAVRSLLVTKDERSTKWHENMTFIKRVNMGIPGGDNWLANWHNTNEDRSSVYVYSIAGNEIVAYFCPASNFNVSEETNFDIMKNIPGVRIGGGSCVVYDYNDDGLDEIFNYDFSGRGFFIEIAGYNADKNEIIYYCSIPFEIIDAEKGPAPVEFLTYKGIKGFKVYYYLNYGTPDHPPKNILDSDHAWYFFAWDEKARKFAEICEYIGEPETNETPVITETPGEAAPEIVNEAEYAVTSVDKPKVSKLVYAAIGVGILFAIIIILLIVRRKRGERTIRKA